MKNGNKKYFKSNHIHNSLLSRKLKILTSKVENLCSLLLSLTKEYLSNTIQYRAFINPARIPRESILLSLEITEIAIKILKDISNMQSIQPSKNFPKYDALFVVLAICPSTQSKINARYITIKPAMEKLIIINKYARICRKILKKVV